MSADKAKIAKIKLEAEEMAWRLIQGGLQTTDPDLAPLVKKLVPHKAKLSKVTRDLLRKGLDLVKIVPTGDDAKDAKATLKALVQKLEGMLPMLGLLG